MATLLKRFVFFLVAASLLSAAPAMSVPLAPTNDRPATVSSDEGLVTQQANTDGQYSPFRRVGDSDGNDAEVGIVGYEQLAYGPKPDDSEVRAIHPEFGMSGQAAMTRTGRSKGAGWVKPVAAIGAGGSLYALLSGKGKDKGGSNGNGGFTEGGTVGGGGVGDGGGGTPPVVNPEPGTLLLMGLGIAGYLKSRKLTKK